MQRPGPYFTLLSRTKRLLFSKLHQQLLRVDCEDKPELLRFEELKQEGISAETLLEPVSAFLIYSK